MSSQQPPDFVIESLKDLKQSFAGLPVERQRVRTSSYVIGFEVDSSALLVEHTEALSPFIATLRDYPASAVVSVVGRASQTGPEASNRQLARDRADRVRAYLIASGVPEDRVGPVVFHGSGDPLVNLPGHEDEMNRSVELVIEWVDLDFESGFTAGGTTEWQLDLTVTFGLAEGIGGQMQIGTLTNRDTGVSKTVTATIFGLDIGVSLFVTAAADAGLPFSNEGVFSMPTPPGPVDFDWFDGRFIVLASVGGSAIVGGVDVAALRFYNSRWTVAGGNLRRLPDRVDAWRRRSRNDRLLQRRSLTEGESPLNLRPDPIEVGLHVVLPLCQTPRDDPRLFLRLRGDPDAQPRRSRPHPGPLANQRTVTGRFHLETPGGPDTVWSDDVPHPAALIFHLDDLAYRLPFAECVVLAAAAKASTDPDAVRIVKPFR